MPTPISSVLKHLTINDLARSFEVVHTDAHGGFELPVPAPSVRHDWMLLAPADTTFPPAFFSIVGDAVARRPDVSVFYFDNEVQAADLDTRYLKPAWDLTLFLAQDYAGLPLLIKSCDFDRLTEPDCRGGRTRAFDVMLRAHAAGLGIERIEVLTQGTAICCARPDARRDAIQRWLESTGEPYAIEPGLTQETLRLKRIFDRYPPVSLVIPAHSAPASGLEQALIRLLASVARTDYPMDKLHVLVGDRVASDSSYAAMRWPFHLQRIAMDDRPGVPGNWSADLNRLWRRAPTEQLVLLSADVSPGSPEWLQALLTHSMQEDVGATGARLLHPDGSIHHAGIAGGVHGLFARLWFNQPGDQPTYQDWAVTPKEWSLLAHAVLATRKSTLSELNGFDENFSEEAGGLDLCLRMRMAGYRLVYTPYAELTHPRPSANADTWPGSELALFLERWQDMLAADPAFHPRLNQTTHIVQPAADANGEANA